MYLNVYNFLIYNASIFFIIDKKGVCIDILLKKQTFLYIPLLYYYLLQTGIELITQTLTHYAKTYK